MSFEKGGGRSEILISDQSSTFKLASFFSPAFAFYPILPICLWIEKGGIVCRSDGNWPRVLSPPPRHAAPSWRRWSRMIPYFYNA